MASEEGFVSDFGNQGPVPNFGGGRTMRSGVLKGGVTVTSVVPVGALSVVDSEGHDCRALTEAGCSAAKIFAVRLQLSTARCRLPTAGTGRVLRWQHERSRLPNTMLV